MSRKKHTSELLNQVGGRIKTFRLQKNLSQEELAYRSNIHATTLSEIESGKANITLITYENIALALNISISSFFPEESLKEDEELSRLIGRMRKAYIDNSAKDKARYISLIKCITDNYS
ncbi:MAG: helix-turn-helix transcriptional regulator [Deferribacteraceae bacterium]|jgi:transcriptional regulator with XRE-family HTH domain|nr:helix-turn-helix transcriptional regulator [Deferribacteraceae bacterium]